LQYQLYQVSEFLVVVVDNLYVIFVFVSFEAALEEPFEESLDEHPVINNPDSSVNITNDIILNPKRFFIMQPLPYY